MTGMNRALACDRIESARKLRRCFHKYCALLERRKFTILLSFSVLKS